MLADRLLDIGGAWVDGVGLFGLILVVTALAVTVWTEASGRR